MVGVLSKQFFNLLAVVVQLRLQHPQLAGARHGQAAFGLGEGFRSAKVGGFREELDAFFIRLRSIQLMGVEEFVESGVCRHWPGLAG
jgi:hypothetical protein